MHSLVALVALDAAAQLRRETARPERRLRRAERTRPSSRPPHGLRHARTEADPQSARADLGDAG